MRTSTSTLLRAAQGLSEAVDGEGAGIPVGKNDRGSGGAVQLDPGDRQSENGACVKIELRQVLRDERDHARVVRAGRKFGKYHVVLGDEEFDTENAVAAQIFDDFCGHLPRLVNAFADMATGCHDSR